MIRKCTASFLLVEDDDNDFDLFRYACRRVADLPPFMRLHDGAEAQQYMSGVSLGLAAIISDLKMPHLDGLELLQWVKQQNHLATTPFFMLSNSGMEYDKERAFKLGAQGFWTKPTTSAELSTIIQEMVHAAFPGETRCARVDCRLA